MYFTTCSWLFAFNNGTIRESLAKQAKANPSTLKLDPAKHIQAKHAKGEQHNAKQRKQNSRIIE